MEGGDLFYKRQTEDPPHILGQVGRPHLRPFGAG